MWTLRTAVVLSVGLLDPSLSVYRDGCLSFSVSVLWLFSVVSPGNVVGRDSVHWACELVLELKCLTVIF